MAIYGKSFRWRRNLPQRRVNVRADQLRPQRWNWYAIAQPLDRRLEERVGETLEPGQLRNLRYFWLDGLFAAVSENFYLGYVALFALAFGATNSEVGLLVAAGNLLGALALFPGAKLVEKVGLRKPVVIWAGGILARAMLLCLALVPLLAGQPQWAILLIVLFEGVRSFMSSLANPGWTAMVADLVPDSARGRYFGSRNMAMGVAALLVAPLAGQIITDTAGATGNDFLGYQIVFLLAFIFGMVSTWSFRRIDEPAPAAGTTAEHRRGDLRRALRKSPWFLGLVASAFIWTMSLQIAAPFFNVYLVEEFGASTATIGALAAVSSIAALVGQGVFSRLVDRKGAFWMLQATGFLIPLLPWAWMFITAPWQVGIINSFGGFVWAGYNLANFNLLLALTPGEQRPRAVALYQVAVFSSAVVGPLVGGYLADTVSYQLIFGLSGAGRLLAILMFAWFTARPYRSAQQEQETHALALH